MALLTEAMLREQFSALQLEDMQEFVVLAGTIVTPSARTFLQDYKVKITFCGKNDEKTVMPQKSSLPPFKKPESFTDEHGRAYAEKPEHLTALRGSALVPKTAGIIKLRGKIDGFEAMIMQVQISMLKQGKAKLVQELEEILAFVRVLLWCEVKEEAVPKTTLLAMSFEEIRERSHWPVKHFGVEHFTPSVKHGEVVVQLNSLRTAVREVEICACLAFEGDDGLPVRADIIEGFNRLSSVFYVQMLRAVTKEYEK